MATLPDHRHECEVRAVLKMRIESQAKAMNYIELVRTKRKSDAIADTLKKDCAAQWQKGNRGNYGDWR